MNASVIRSICTFFLALFSVATYGQYITTIAGNGVYGYSGDYGPATAAALMHPRDVVVDDSGYVYIADTYNFRIRKIDKNGNISTYAGDGSFGYSGDNGPATVAQISSCTGIGLDKRGNLYVAGGPVVRKITAAGIITTVAGNNSAAYSGDNGPATAASMENTFDVAADKWGNLYISDVINARVRKVDTFGIITTIAGTGTVGYSGDGGPATAAQITNPVQIVVDSTGNVFFNSGDVVRKIDVAGIITTIAGTHVLGYSGDGGPATAAQIYSEGLAIDNNGNIYLGDYHSSCVRKINSAGIITTVAGSYPLAGYSGDGEPATAASLAAPSGIDIDNQGNIYIADQLNDRIRKTYPHTDGISGVNASPCNIFPNPSNGNLTVTIPEGQEHATITISSMLGTVIKQVETNGKEKIALYVDAPNGLYILSTKTPNGTTSQQFIISK